MPVVGCHSRGCSYGRSDVVVGVVDAGFDRRLEVNKLNKRILLLLSVVVSCCLLLLVLRCCWSLSHLVACFWTLVVGYLLFSFVTF